jgi:DUF438 domain-containing protein
VANIIFVYIEVQMNQSGLNFRDLVELYDQQGNGYLTHEEFTNFMSTLPIELTYVLTASTDPSSVVADWPPILSRTWSVSAKMPHATSPPSH